MKWCNKSNLVVLLFLLIACMASEGFAQMYQHPGFQRGSLGGLQSHHFSRYVQPVQAASYPLQYTSEDSYRGDMFRHPRVEYSAASPPTKSYSGYYYDVQNAARYPNPLQISNSHLRNYFRNPVQHAVYNRPPTHPIYSAKVPQFKSPSPSHSDTYREAVDLFSEVVHKLEKGNGPGSYVRNFASPQLNGIGGSSSFPHYLDHIMGPDFLQRAEKLYNKIIHEQSSRLQQQPSMNYPVYNKNVNGYVGLGVHGSNPHQYSRPTHYPYSYPQSHNHPSPYSRAMTLEPTPTSLADTVKAMEVETRRNQSSDEDKMETSESNDEPSVVADPGEDEEPEQAETAARKDAYVEVKGKFENEVEHPLPYDVYEGLVKDIATNHNY